MIRRHVVVMVKEPVPGRVKTRLGRDLGMTAAAWWMRHQTRRLIRRLSDPRWRLILAVTPDRAIASRMWGPAPPRRPQGQGDLGTRMARIFRRMPRGRVVIVGADIPGVTRAHLERAFRALGPADAVIGPAPDGGYWLIGMRRLRPLARNPFDGVRWSSSHARADTRAALADLRVAQIDWLADVDTAADLWADQPRSAITGP